MEKFIVSARKYRPQTFDTVVGQSHITTTLKNAIRTSQLAHAFLFCGPRGVGKTTCARILAKTINCESLTSDGEACNTCSSCTSFNNGASLNIHELDAASNNSVDDIRTLVEQVRFNPQAGKYKVYIIDEVHMLTSQAFNAFLKTLEEPPSYAIFILATTEKHKILPTILSRCQVFDFKRITANDTVAHLKVITGKEQVDMEDEALHLIAQKSEGCMRDALSIFDKIVSFTGGKLTYSDTLEHLNILDAEYYFQLLKCMQEQDLSQALLLFDQINRRGFEGDIILNGFAEFFRNLLVSKDEKVAVLLDVVESFKEKYTAAAAGVPAGLIISALNILNEAEIGFKSARNKRLHTEMTLIKLCYLQQAIQLAADPSGMGKKKITDNVKALGFRQLQPIRWNNTAKVVSDTPVPVLKKEAETVVETIIVEQPRKVVAAAAVNLSAPSTTVPVKQATTGRLSSLKNIREQFTGNDGLYQQKQHTVITMEALTEAWQAYTALLRNATGKLLEMQAFEDAELKIVDERTFEVTAVSNIAQRFIEQERVDLSPHLVKHLKNDYLVYTVGFKEVDYTTANIPVHYSSKDAFSDMVKDNPWVKELRDRLRLELDF